MIKESININTYLNIALILFVGLVSYIVYGIRDDLVENRKTIRENQKRTEEKLDQILSLIYDNKIKITSVSERLNYHEARISKLEHVE